MRIVLAVVLALSASQAIAADCTVKCPPGYLGLCVEVTADCSCRCVKDASGGAEAVAALLRDKGASEDAIQRAVQAYKTMIERGLTEFSFEITDKGQTYTVVSSSRNE